MICLAVYVACRAYRVAATLPVLVVALVLLEAGIIKS